MTVLDAVAKVLDETPEGLHYREITQRVIAQGLWSPAGRTPEATVASRLTSEIKKKGIDSRFRRVSPGVYALGAPSVAKTGATLSFTDAAEKVLDEYAGRQPM